MQIIDKLITPVLIAVVVKILFSKINKDNLKDIVENQSKEHIQIRLPKVYLWVGCGVIIVFAAFIAFMILVPNDTAAAWVFVGFVVLICIGAAIVLQAMLWKIEIFRSQNYFIIRPLIKTYRVKYDDCIFYKYGTNSLTLKTKKRTFYIDTYARGFEFFLAMLIKYKVPEKKQHNRRGRT